MNPVIIQRFPTGNRTLKLTEAFQGVGHSLVLHHVDEAPPQAEVREDEQNVLQDVVDPSDLLQNPNNRLSTEPPPNTAYSC